ncbi:cobalt-precorrin 5A hydrolase [Caldalkalibacillus salinus]|uniref:cobalt-precorrin 5A hydrolase n=1 Tax=Caldalkalibacillus salinus TaxID=2803787 RepID=UPI00192120FE|nr:cobalamin biosynthesis protein [Caldalkalibacillus salinus]
MTIQLATETDITIEQRGTIAVVAITKHGVALARQLQQTDPHADLYYMSKFEQGDEAELHIQLFEGSVRRLLPTLFKHYQGIVLVISLGAVVRMIAPLLKDKKTDPGVVVIDDKGAFVISVLSGHLGGANALTREIAAALKATPVITTASDVQQTIPVDIFGQSFGWTWESAEKLTPVSAAVVNEERIAVIQESGERHWWPHDRPLPEHIKLYHSPQEVLSLAEPPDATLIITHRHLSKEERTLLDNGILYRPKVIVLGIGCNKGTTSDEIEATIHETLDELNFSIKSVKAVCTIDLKKDEVGLRAVVQKHAWDFHYYTPEALNEVEIEEPSQTVYKFTGAYGVSEPACRLYCRNEGPNEGHNRSLALVKKKKGNMTLSVGVLSFA